MSRRAGAEKGRKEDKNKPASEKEVKMPNRGKNGIKCSMFIFDRSHERNI